MKFKIINLVTIFALLLFPLQLMGGATPAHAGDDPCLGVIRGISNNYNLRRGVVVLDRNGSWLWINYGNGGAGWVHRKFVRVSC